MNEIEISTRIRLDQDAVLREISNKSGAPLTRIFQHALDIYIIALESKREELGIMTPKSLRGKTLKEMVNTFARASKQTKRKSRPKITIKKSLDRALENGYLPVDTTKGIKIKR